MTLILCISFGKRPEVLSHEKDMSLRPSRRHMGGEDSMSVQ